MKPVSDKALLVIALSSRPYVEAATQAGFRVVAIDAFADRQTHDATERVFTVDYGEYGFNPDMMMSIIATLNVNDFWGVIYGGGFEAQPALLQFIADKIPLMGNDPATVAAVKTPDIFFAAFAKLAIPQPRLYAWHSTERTTNPSQKSVIRKLAGGSGGTHIHYLTESQPALNYYDQEYLQGDSVSVLFLACEGQVEVLGFNEQWLDPLPSVPFRYGGAVSNIQLAKNVEAQLIQAAQKLTRAFKLKGINSLDAIVHKELAYVLEINPRLSATLDLYPAKAVNLLRHIEACQAQPESKSLMTLPCKAHHAHAIVYARVALAIPTAFDWPDWATDIPRDGLIAAQQPVCTVLATGESSDAAKQLAQSRVKMLLKSMAATH